jgi:hypothetical protein
MLIPSSGRGRHDSPDRTADPTFRAQARHVDQPVLLQADEEHPELAFFAAFAMHERHGKTARRVVTRALQLTARLPEPLQQAQLRAIFNVLSEPMLAWLEEVAMQPETMPESAAFRALRQRLEARGEAQALLTVLATRNIPVDEAARARVLGCQDRATLERWIARAVTASALAEVFAEG